MLQDMGVGSLGARPEMREKVVKKSIERQSVSTCTRPRRGPHTKGPRACVTIIGSLARLGSRILNLNFKELIKSRE